MTSKKLFAVWSFCLASGCATYRVSDIGPIVQLPASKACYQVFTISKREVFYPPLECEKIKARAILMTSETWRILRGDIQRNCQMAKCKEITGALDGLFLSLDAGLQKIKP